MSVSNPTPGMRALFQEAYSEVSESPARLLSHLWVGVGYCLGAGMYGVAASLLVCQEHMFPDEATPDIVLELLRPSEPGERT